MSAKLTYETQRIDHLGIVTGIRQEISMIETVDALVKTSERIASYGKGAQAIILKEAKDIY